MIIFNVNYYPIVEVKNLPNLIFEVFEIFSITFLYIHKCSPTFSYIFFSSIRQVMANKTKHDQIVVFRTGGVPNNEFVKQLKVCRKTG